MNVKEGAVHGRIGLAKTEYSEDAVPLDPEAATIFLDWKRESKGYELVFPSPITGYSYDASPIQQDWIRRAGWCLVECPECGAAPGVACTLSTRVAVSGTTSQCMIRVVNWRSRESSAALAGTRFDTRTARSWAN
jgi:hypothetical protein